MLEPIRVAHQYGASIQIFLNLGTTILGEGLCIFTFFLLLLLKGFDFYFNLYFEWRDTEKPAIVNDILVLV